MKITGVRFFKNQVILKFKEFQDINEVERYRGRDLLITRDQAVPLEENENFITDLIDLEAVSYTHLFCSEDDASYGCSYKY